MSGIKSQGFKRDGEKEAPEAFAEEAKYFTEVRLLQRDIKLRIEGVSNQNVVATVIHPVSQLQLVLSSRDNELLAFYNEIIEVTDHSTNVAKATALM